LYTPPAASGATIALSIPVACRSCASSPFLGDVYRTIKNVKTVEHPQRLMALVGRCFII
jgi:hypothetical protein